MPIVIWTHSSGGPGEYAWNDFVYHGTKNLLDAGIGVMYVDNFCHRGARDTWRDQSKVPLINGCLLYTSPSPRDRTRSRMPSSA